MSASVAPAQQPDPRPPSVLTVAGSDSGGGAGIQADLKTFAAHGLHGLSAIAALTAQHTRGVTAVLPVPPDFLRRQIAAAFDDFRVASVKIGMLAEVGPIEALAAALDAQAGGIPVVLDPVMIASSGARLLAEDAIQALRARLIPRADVLTPNLPEAEALLGRSIAGRAEMPAAAQALRALGARAVLLKGGHLADDRLLDLYCDATALIAFEHPRLPLEGHGTGCTLSSAVAAGLALGRAPPEACRQACDYVHGALRHAYRPGLGTVAVLDHFWSHRGA